MGKYDQSSAWRYQLTYHIAGGTICLGAKVGNANNYAIAITDLVKRPEGTDMFVIGSDYLIAFLPIKPVANDIQPFASIISQRNLAGIGVQQLSNTAARIIVDSEEFVKRLRSQPPIAPFILHALLHSLYDTTC